MHTLLTIPSDDHVISAQLDSADSPSALLILSHGAGAGMDHVFMADLANALCGLGISVLRFNFPYIDQGRRAPTSPKKAQGAINTVVSYANKHYPELPLFVSGKSYGGRMASHCAAQKSIDQVRGLIFYGFPLHAPGRDSKDRANHLSEVTIPMLFLQGTNDKLANIDLITEVTADLGAMAQLDTFDSADHSFKVPKRIGISSSEIIHQLAAMSAQWINSTV